MEEKFEYISEDENLEVKVHSFMGGLHWLYTNKTTKDTLSVILHSGSYGNSSGLFEIMPSWKKFRYDSVKGYLTFGDVQRWINKLKKLK